MMARKLTRSIHGSVTARWHSMLLLAVRRDMLLLLRLMLMAGPGCGPSTHVVRMVVVMVGDRITWSEVKLRRCHARLPGSGWPMHALMVHMVRVGGWNR